MIRGGLEAGGMSSKQRKLYVREVKHQNRAQKRKLDDADWKDQPITFTPTNLEGVVTPHNDPLVISVMINNCQVQRVLVDTGSALDIMYYHCFESLGLDLALLQCYDGPIYGFNNQLVPIEGILTMNVAFGSGRTYVTPSVRFLVKDKDQLAENPPQEIHDNRQVMGVEILDNRPEDETRATLGEDVEETCREFPPRYLNTNSTVIHSKKPVAQKRRLFGGKGVANPMLVKKANGKWQMCIDYTNLNQACPKDCYPMPNIDKLVKAVSGNERLSLLDAYSSYHQVPMALEDEEKTSFYIGDEIYCYVMMSFGLKNVGAIYQKMVTIVFRAQIGWNLEFIRGIEVNLQKIKAVAEIESSKLVKDVQRLTWRVAALHRFISKSVDKWLPFFKIMRLAAQKDESGKQKKLEWNSEYQVAFDELKSYLSSPPLLSKANDKEILYLYLGISDEAISSVLVREERKQQKPIYYTSSVLHGNEIKYSITKKTALAVILYVDGASSNKGSGVGAILLGLDGYRSEHALKFNFDATNNMTEYEALLLGLQLAIELKVVAIQICSNSQLVVNQVNSVCEVVDPVMMKNEVEEESISVHLVNDVLYKRSFSLPLLRCLNPYEAEYALWEVHEGVYRSHIGARTLAHKVLRQGYYWPNMYKDATQFVQRCQKCPFMKGVRGVTHLIVSVDYFTKWVKAQPLSGLTSKKVEDFVFSSIICRYGIPNQIVADNRTQFNCSSFKDFCSSYGIKLQFTSVYHPKSNGMVKSVNKVILEGIKPRLELHKARWVDELNNVLWAYKTTSRTATIYKHKIANFYNKRVRPRTFKVGDIVLRKAGLMGFETRFGKLAPNWEGPYTIAEVPHLGAYILRDTEGKKVPRVWNVNNLKKFYP
ncbi:hypothetical protein SLEP1_g49664 [Rubroshorea leprosula]|uniref:Integrase catalytic domain-containing protein n=1 Tax=Rubroshorea leprosula TaxID=152421 RepID=A0AAV5LXP0_9ROSI|nr:hypothetical protein SLEP1_g49664 [Rubroshorea leprosula]